MFDSGYRVSLLASNGDSWVAPTSTEEALWAALGAGADGFIVSLAITADETVVCTPALHVRKTDDPETEPEEVDVSMLTLAQLQAIDAGYDFCSQDVDDDGQATGSRGDDFPWRGRAKPKDSPLKARIRVVYPALATVLQQFGRRSHVLIQFDPSTDSQAAIIDTALANINQYGLLERVAIIGTPNVLQQIREQHPVANLVLDCRNTDLDESIVQSAISVHALAIYIDGDKLLEMDSDVRQRMLEAAHEAGIRWYVGTPARSISPGAALLEYLRTLGAQVACIVAGSPLITREQLLPSAETLSETFSGTEFNRAQWRAGYSCLNTQIKEVTIEVNDGLIISLADGQRYAGAAAATAVPVHGDFDATVDFHVSAPNQATTFEMAAIAIDPGYHITDNEKLTSKKVNLSFDVHGAPPYASSERDQNDGFRCGWNNSFNLSRVSMELWEARSVNMYNKYGRGVGDGSAESLSGTLRLVRSGAVFSSYYRDKHNPAWVCSGTMLVSTLPEDTFIRLAAKHWDKQGNRPPQNVVSFRNFSLRQR